jgi:hypothetical protein
VAEGSTDGDAAPEAVGGAAEGTAEGVDGAGVVGDAQPARTTVRSRERRFMLARFVIGTRRTPPRGTGTAIESHGPASFAGMSQIRFGGSVAGATLSARSRSPEAVFCCARL